MSKIIDIRTVLRCLILFFLGQPWLHGTGLKIIYVSVDSWKASSIESANFRLCSVAEVCETQSFGNFCKEQASAERKQKQT